MKLKKLIIYGFGKHENVSLNLTDGINVIYGLNEAGKTTIQQFILHILFGFPLKNQNLLRYEPKSGLKYGGQVHIEHEEYGTVIVERVKGKAAGDVIVYFPDGSRGSDESLKKLLYQYDRSSFESIFSFSLLQLQGFENMDEMELSRTLLASGTTGVDTLTDLEKRMLKEMNELFKPSGKKPEMNLRMDELRQLELELKEERKKIEEYEPAILRLNEIDEELSKFNEEESSLRDEQKGLSLFRQAIPLVNKRKTTELLVENYGELHFPADGIRRMDSIDGRLVSVRATIEQLKQEIGSISQQDELNLLEDKLRALEELISRETEWHQWRSEGKQTVERVRKLKEQKQNLSTQLGLSNHALEKTIVHADLSLQQEEKLHLLIKEYEEIENEINFQQKNTKLIQQDLLEVESNIARLQSNEPSEDEKKRIYRWPEIQRELSEAKAYVSLHQHSSENTQQPFMFIISLLSLFGTIYGLIAQNYIIAGISIVLFATSVVLWTKGKKKTSANSSNKLKAMQKVIHEYSHKEAEIERQYLQLQNDENKMRNLIEQRDQYTRKLQHTEQNMNQLYTKLDLIMTRLEQFTSSYGFKELPSITLLPQLFKMLHSVQEVALKIYDTEEELHSLKERIGLRHREGIRILGDNFYSEEELYAFLREAHSKLLDKRTAILHSRKTYNEKLKELEEKNLHLAELEKEQSKLLEVANTTTIDDYYRVYYSYQEKEELVRELTQINAQLDSIGQLKGIEHMHEEEIENRALLIEQRLTQVQLNIDAYRQEKVRLQHVTKILLSDETYSIKLQQFEMKKAELSEMAKNWSVKKTVSAAITLTMRNLKEKKLPEVLESAKSYFYLLSDQRYAELVVNAEGIFEAVSNDGIHFSIAELSQATKEQAYISLRFALAESLKNSAPFPIIMDDPFVHFDRRRLQHMIQLMSELKYDRQFLYFTCHDEMKDVWPDVNVVNVSQLSKNRGAIIS